MKIKNFFKKIKNWTVSNKKISIAIFIVLVVILYFSFKDFNSSTEVTYKTVSVTRGNIVSAVSGSGQVSALNQINIKTKTSGDVVHVGVTSGKEVKAGEIIARLDSTDALYDLESAQISYEELVNIDSDDLKSLQDSVDDAKDSLENNYADAKATLISVSTSMTDIMNGLSDLFDYRDGFLSVKSSYNLGSTAKDYRARAEDSFNKTNLLFKEYLKNYRSISSISEEEIEGLLSEVYNISINISETTKYTQDAVTYFIDQKDSESSNTESDEAYTSMTSLVSKSSSLVSSVYSTKNSILSARKTLENAREDLDDLLDGPDVLDLRSEALSLKEKQEAYNNCFIIAPFDGYISNIEVENSDSVSSGATVATIITKQKIAEITLNEVDAAKVKIGQKVDITFDAISDLNITGKVSEMDTVGTVSSGVVNYDATITFDTQDDRIKSGMSVSVSIVTDMKTDVLVIPSEAVKTGNNGNSYVEILDNNSNVLEKEVEVGISDDTYVEVISGIEEGEKIITKTSSGSNSTKTTNNNSSARSATSLIGGMDGGPRN